MSTPVGPWVNFLTEQVSNIGNTPTIIFPAISNAAILDSLLWTNKVDVSINVSAYILRGENQTSVPGAIIEPFGFVDRLENSTLYMEPGDILYAYSDFSGKLFDSLIAYRVLNEIGSPE
jgi:hypothetical protein